MSPQRKVLVAGASGVVGYAAVKHFASLPGWHVVGVARRPPTDVPGADTRSVDLGDARQSASVLTELADVTHAPVAPAQGLVSDKQPQARPADTMPCCTVSSTLRA